MKHLMVVSLTVFSVFLFLAAPASSYTVYSSDYSNMGSTRSAWLDSLGISHPDTTIDFETDFSDGQNILGAALPGGLVINSDAGYAFVTDNPGDLGSSLPIGTYALAVDEGDNYTFDFSSPIAYFGFYMMDNAPTDLEIHYADGSPFATTSIPHGGGGGHQGAFFALTFDLLVSSLYIPNVEGGDGEVGIDNIEFGATPVPVPATMLLLGSGLTGFAGFRRKFRER